MKKSVIVLIGLVSFCVACNSGSEKINKEGTSNVTDVKKDTIVKPDLNFQKKLSLQGVEYAITSIGNGSVLNVIVIPSGFKEKMDTIKFQSDPILGAEMEDLDHDGFPELLIYSQSAGSGSYGHVIAYSPNKGKSISPIYFPDLVVNSPESKGYMGHDQFTIIESSLSRRFPIYEQNSFNSKPTGKIRQLQYKLKNGEASKKFVLMETIEFAKPD